MLQSETSARVRRLRLVVFGLGLYLEVVLVLLVNSPLLKAQTLPPAIDFQAVVSRDKVERNEPVNIYLSIVSKASVPLRISGINAQNDSFDTTKLPSLPILLEPYGSSRLSITINARDTTKFGLQRLLVSVDFNWVDDGKAFSSTQATTVTLEVARRFEDEAKGFPGGTAAFLYLLLPIIPAFLSYQTIERLRTGKGLQIPTFQSEYIVPAFFAAIIISFLMLIIARTDTGIDYSNPRVFLGVLTGSLVLGAVVPCAHAGWNLIQKLRWGFSPNDSMATYIEKALFGPRRPRQFRWVKATLNGESWEGILLEQPNTVKVLGACLQASLANASDDESYQKAVHELELKVLDRTGALKDARRLVELAKTGEIKLDYISKIKQGDNTLNSVVIVEGIANLEIVGPTEVKPLVKLVG
jgi:hypothetical protein